jgi:tRNA threonylcarbamoyladenosine biosynthesis protein TsaE
MAQRGRLMLTAVVARSPDDTRAAGSRLGHAAGAGDVLLLDGPLGAGKTVLVQGLAEGLGCTAEVVSPTFVLVRQYQGRTLELVHADLYRLDDRAEIEALGLLELSADGVLALEWADRAPWLEASQAARITITAGEGERERELHLVGGPGRLHAALAAASVPRS